MTIAIVQDNGALNIIFNDKTKREFELGLDIWTKVSIAGLALFGGMGSMIAGNMALNNQIKATSQQWASAINALIAKGKLPEMIYCKYCGTKNKSIDPKCLHCGAILEKKLVFVLDWHFIPLVIRFSPIEIIEQTARMFYRSPLYMKGGGGISETGRFY